MEYFKRLGDLLKMERDADRQQYKELAGRLSITERRSGGLAWYPIAIRETEISRADYLTVEVERTTHMDLTHQLRFGAPAALFSNHNPADRLEGIITYQGGNRLKIALRTDELPEWSKDGKLGIDLLFDDNSYEEMFNALKQASALLENSEDGRLVRMLIGINPPSFRTDYSSVSLPKLNRSQNAAVNKILAANDIAIVHGPPGTGKTTTLVQAIKAMIQRDHRQILVVAPSNTAVDLLTEKLSDEGLDTLRIGNPARVSEHLMSLTLDSKMASHPLIKEIKRLKKQANEFRDMAHKYKRSFGKAERDQRKALFDEARNIGKEVERTEQFILKNVISKAQVITATLVGANHYTIRNLRFDTVVIDEAGQALEPASWIPILKASKLILAGDHCQLPPTVRSDEASRGGLIVSLLEKTAALHPEAVATLEEQYRMHAAIMGYSSQTFYGGRLHAAPSVAGHLLFPGDTPLLFVDTAGCGFEEKTERTALSNPEEAAFLWKHLSQAMADFTSHSTNVPFPTIGVISPYRHQVHLLQELFAHASFLLPHATNISINTIDGFQGQERDIIYISMTRSNPDSRIGFLSEIRRMNVAMTRARKKLVVIGDSATLSRLPFYADFITYTEKADAYKSAWEFIES